MILTRKHTQLQTKRESENHTPGKDEEVFGYYNLILKMGQT